MDYSVVIAGGRAIRALKGDVKKYNKKFKNTKEKQASPAYLILPLRTHRGPTLSPWAVLTTLRSACETPGLYSHTLGTEFQNRKRNSASRLGPNQTCFRSCCWRPPWHL